MVFSRMLRRVALLRTDVSVEPSASFLRNSVLIRATRCNIPEDTILHSHRRENLESYNFIIIYLDPIVGVCSAFKKE
jgi:hypothetical protein